MKYQFDDFDEVDSRIICFLQKDGRMPYTKIAEKLGIAEATVRARAQNLMKKGIIQIVAISDPMKLGFSVVGNVKLIINVKERARIIDELKKIEAITYIALMTGSADIDIDFMVRSLDDLRILIYDNIHKISGIIQTQTSIIMRYEKDTYTWGTIYEDNH